MVAKPRVHKPQGMDARQRYDRGTRRDDPRLANAAKQRSSARWKKFRLWFMAQFPLCEPCKARSFTVAAQEVHHKIPLRYRPELLCDMLNCMSVCVPCHRSLDAEIEARERA